MHSRILMSVLSFAVLILIPVTSTSLEPAAELSGKFIDQFLIMEADTITWQNLEETKLQLNGH